MISVFYAAILIAISVATANANEARIDIIAWGANPSINAPRVDVSAYRVACAGHLSDCFSHAISGGESTPKIALSIPPTVSAGAAIAAFDSLDGPTIDSRILEVGIDDFAAFARREMRVRHLVNATAADLMTSKLLRDGRIPLALTVYEDELDELSVISDSNLLALMKSTKRIAFYLHFRRSVESYLNFLPKLGLLFPNARIYGGVYHYDRSDYIACGLDSNVRCSVREDIDLYGALLDVIARSHEAGLISGIELYPGVIGREATWSGWKKSRLCKPQRFDECVSTSQRMGLMFVEKFGN